MDDRRRALVEAGIAIGSELSLDAVLQKLVSTAAELTGARYAALGVIDASGQALARFITHGITERERAAIGDLPTGKGVLGVLLREATPVRLADISADPRSVGFPPNHPPMRNFLGVPVKLREVAYGNLYLTEKAESPVFSEDDEEIVTLLAAQAAVAIENARLYEDATRWSRQLESLNEIAAALAREVELPRQLEMLTDHLRDLLAVCSVAVALRQPDLTLRLEATSGDPLEELDLGTGSVAASVVSNRESRQVDVAELEAKATDFGGQALFVPLVVGGRSLGLIVAVGSPQAGPRFSSEELRLAEGFAERAAVAVDLSQRVARDALRRAVAAQELERRRLARELHDETGQALTSILLGLASIEAARNAGEVRTSVAGVRELVVSTLQDVRRLAVELRPAALDDFGLVPALRRLGATVREASHLDVQVEARLGAARLPAEIETAVYRIVQEALTNVVKHADARHVSVVLTRKNRGVTVMIEDDGHGFDPTELREHGLGLLGMQERVRLLDGELHVESTSEAGTTLVLELGLP